jgi:hypothetical protein
MKKRGLIADLRHSNFSNAASDSLAVMSSCFSQSGEVTRKSLSHVNRMRFIAIVVIKVIKIEGTIRRRLFQCPM